MVIPAMIRLRLFGEGMIKGPLQLMNCATNSLLHEAVLVRNDDEFAAVAMDLDRATFVVVTGFVTDLVAKMHIDPPHSILVTPEYHMDRRFHVV